MNTKVTLEISGLKEGLVKYDPDWGPKFMPLRIIRRVLMYWEKIKQHIILRFSEEYFIQLS